MGGGSPPGGGPPNASTIAARQSSNTTTTNSTTSSAGSYDVTIGDKAFHETYLAPFYDAVKNGVAGTMCAMNKVNGTYSCESQDLLAKYLKVELGMPGIVHADVGAQHTGINSANAGMDQGSSFDWSTSTLGVGLTNGSFTAARLDDMVIRNMMGYFHYKQDEGYPAKVAVEAFVDVRGNHSKLARTYAANSLVLLKNSNNALPLKSPRSVSIFGSHASPRYVGANTALSVYDGVGPTMTGHMTTVGGSAMGSLGKKTRLQLLDHIQESKLTPIFQRSFQHRSRNSSREPLKVPRPPAQASCSAGGSMIPPSPPHLEVCLEVEPR